MSKMMEIYTINKHQLLYIDYTSIKPFFKKDYYSFQIMIQLC